MKSHLAGYVNFTNPNYDFLGNSISYSFSTQSNDKPNQGYENKIFQQVLAQHLNNTEI